MELFRLLGRIAIDNTEANSALNETTTQAQNASNETSSAFEKIGGAASKIAMGIGAAGLAIGGAFIGAIEGTREYRVEMRKLETAFTTNGHSATVAKQTYSDLNAVLGDSGQAVEAANHLAVLTDNEKDLQTWTNICTGVYATFGASLPIEGLTEAANETAKTGILTGGLTDALNWAGISEEQFQEKLDACSNEQERQKLIMDTLNKTYKDASVQYQETNADVIASEKAQERLTDAMAEVGRIGEPIMTRVKNAIASMAEKAVPVIASVVTKVQDMSKWIKDNESKVKVWKAVIIGVTTSIASLILIMKWSAIMSAAANGIKLVTVAMKALNLAMKANIIGIIVSLIVGLVAAFIYLWNNCDSFRNFWIGLWNKIKSASGTAIEWIKNKFNAFKSALSTVKNVFGGIKDTISDKIEGAKNAVKKAIDKIKGFFNTTLKFKGLKMPSIKLTMEKGSGLMAKAADLLGLSGVPKFSVKWNADGMVLTKPTLFGRMGDTFLGGGEAGAEAVAPIDVLQGYTREAVSDGMNMAFYELIENTRTIIVMLGKLLQRNIYLDSGTLVGELAPLMDDELGEIEARRLRGNL